jgi:hypothetical protein
MSGSERGLGMAVVRVRELAPGDPGLKRFETLRADVAALQDATARASALGTSCTELDQLAKEAKEAHGKAAAYLDRVAQHARRAQIDKLDAAVHAITQKSPDLAASDLPALRAEIAAAKAGAAELACLEPSRGAPVVADVDAWAVRRDKAIADEQACRDSAPCMKKRLIIELGAELCATLDNKRDAQAQVAEIRRNGARFGVIDLAELNDAAQTVVLFEQRYKEQAADYRQRIGKPFSAALCKTLAP